MAEERIQITLSQDGAEAHVSICPGPPLATGALRAALSKAGIREGLDEPACEALDEGLAEESFEQPDVRVAQGRPAKPGEDGQLSLQREVGLQAGTLREDGSMDLFERALLTPVAQGEEVARRSKPTKGEAGVDVRGARIPAADGKPEKTRLGKGVKEAKDGSIVATRAGVLRHDLGALLDVVDHHKHEGDVDVSTGHLDTLGSLSIKGQLRRNFEIRVDGDVEIHGRVDGGRIYASGSVRVDGGVIGLDHGLVSCAHDVAARHTQNARIEAGQSVCVQTHAVNSRIEARTIEVAGRLIGGEARAELRVEVNEAGSPSGGGTLLEAGVLHPPVLEVHRVLAAHGHAVELPEEDPTEQEEEAAAQTRHQREHELLLAAEVVVRTCAHEGVRVKLGKYVAHVERETMGVRFRFDPACDQIVRETL